MEVLATCELLQADFSDSMLHFNLYNQMPSISFYHEDSFLSADRGYAFSG